jgi:multidrug efflux pump subunit AcrB
MADLDPQALVARDLSPADVSRALQRQNVILPAGDVKIGRKDYILAMNNSPDVIGRINDFPIKQVDGKTIFMRDIAHVHDGYQVQTLRLGQRNARRAITVPRPARVDSPSSTASCLFPDREYHSQGSVDPGLRPVGLRPAH